MTRLTASQVIEVTDVLVDLFHHSDRIVDGAIEVLWRKKRFIKLLVIETIIESMKPLGGVSLDSFTCVALACSRNQAVLLACRVDVTTI